ncbi:MAG: AAA family ATPase [Ramlibacter sp.]
MNDFASSQLANPGTHHRRNLTMLFCDLTDSTRIASTLEAEDYQELLRAFRNLYEDVVPRYGGVIAQIQGDGFLAIFGYPEPHESDARRAAQATLELHRRVEAMRLDIPMHGRRCFTAHSGIHSGQVLLAGGDAARGRFDVTGAAINVAARLAGYARPGELVVSEETLGPELMRFRTGECESFVPRGQDTPLRVYRVLGEATAGTPLSGSAVWRRRAAFVGRDAEVALLHARLQEAGSGHAVHLTITAPAGVGKTRLAREFIGQLPADYEVAFAECEGRYSSAPLHPFLQMLRARLGIGTGTPGSEDIARLQQDLDSFGERLANHRDDLARALLSSPEADGSQPVAGEQLVRAVLAYLRALSSHRPLVLFVDDSQWADDLSRRVLNSLSGMREARILALSTTRALSGTETLLTQVHVLELPPLDPGHAQVMVQTLVPQASPFEVDQIVNYAGGNSLFIEELCHSLRNGELGGPLRLSNQGVAWLNVLIESRFARLNAEQAALARAAAVIGLEVPLWLLTRMTGKAAGDPVLRALSEHDFLTESARPDTLRFKHGIVRDVIYESVSARERRQLHRRIAQMVLESVPAGREAEVAEALAYHHEAAGDTEACVRYAEMAGDKAQGSSALDQAVKQYTVALKALDLLEPGAERDARWVSIAVRIGIAAAYDPSREQLAPLARAVELARASGDASARAETEFWFGYVTYALGDAKTSISRLRQAQASAHALGDRGVIARVEAALGHALMAACAYAEAEPFLAPYALSQSQTRSAGRAYSVANWATIQADRGHFSQANAAFELALEQLGPHPRAVTGSVLSQYILTLLWQARWSEAEAVGQRAETLAQRVESLYLLCMAIGLRCYAQWRRSRMPGAREKIQHVTRILEDRGRQLFLSLYHGYLAEIAQSEGDVPAMRRAVGQALGRARQRDYHGLATAYRALARESVRSDPSGARARRALSRADWAAQRRQSIPDKVLNLLARAEIEAQLQAPDAAAAACAQALHLADALGSAWHAEEARAVALRWQLELGRVPAAR